jgi:hypothetical protein
MSAITPEIGGTIIVSDANEVDRVILGDLGNGDFGLKVVGPDGTTEIIDGISDVFTILATGTLSVTVADGAAGSDSATHPELGTYAIPPAFNAGINHSGGTGYFANPHSTIGMVGGALVTTTYAEVSVGLSIGTVTVTLDVYNENGSTITRNARYYILRQLGL